MPTPGDVKHFLDAVPVLRGAARRAQLALGSEGNDRKPPDKGRGARSNRKRDPAMLHRAMQHWWQELDTLLAFPAGMLPN
jgi:hypothetical protein